MACAQSYVRAGHTALLQYLTEGPVRWLSVLSSQVVPEAIETLMYVHGYNKYPGLKIFEIPEGERGKGRCRYNVVHYRWVETKYEKDIKHEICLSVA